MAYVAGLGVIPPPPSAALDAARAAFNGAIAKAAARGAPADVLAYWRSLDDGTLGVDDYSSWTTKVKAWRPGKDVFGVAMPSIYGVDPLAVGFVAFALGMTGLAVYLAKKRKQT